MTPSFDQLVKQLKKLPGLGFRSAQRIALHLLVEQPEQLHEVMESLDLAAKNVRRCDCCGNLAEEELCMVCQSDRRDQSLLCVVEQVPDLIAIESSAAFSGVYHVLHGKLSPIQGRGADKLNLASLKDRLEDGEISEIILALSNDIEGEATCHFIQEQVVGELPVKVSRIGFGLPSGGGVLYADQVTLKSALQGRRDFDS